MKAILTLIAPHLVKGIDDEQLNSAFEFAERYRPKCLPQEKQDEAVALYVAYLLASQQEAVNLPVGITSEKEGDLQRSFGDNGLNSAKSYLERYHKLADVCLRVGAMTVGYNYGH